VARIALALSLVAIVIRCFGVRRAAALMWKLADRSPAGAQPASDPLQTGRTLAGRIAAVAARMPFRPHCLTISLLLAGALRRHGIAGELCVGVSGIDEFSAHAWVELDSVVLNDTADVAVRFHPIWRDPPLPSGTRSR